MGVGWKGLLSRQSAGIPVVIIAVAALLTVIIISPAAIPQSDVSTNTTDLIVGDNITLRSLDVEISLQDDGGANWRVEMAYTTPVDHTAYLVLAHVENLQVKADDKPVECSIEKRDIGTLLDCQAMNGSLIVYSFRTPDVARKIGEFRNFAYTFRISVLMNFYALKISLPLGSALVDADKLEGTGLSPFRPSFGREGSNGRLILVSWESPTPNVGEVIDASVMYEQLTRNEIPQIMWITAAVAIILAGFFGWLWYSRSRPERLLPALGERERPVMELVIKHKNLDQRDIVQATSWPKAKVSRAIRVLSDRGLIEALPKGRTKEVRLVEQHATHRGIINRILRFKVKQRAAEMGLSRGQAIELVQMTLTPLIDWAEMIGRKLHSHKFGYTWSDSTNDWSLDGWSNPISGEQKERHLRDVKGLAPKIEERLSATEAALLDVERELERTKDSIMANKKFAAAFKSLKAKGSGIKPEQIVGHLIDNDKIINTSYPWAQMWNTRSRELLKSADCAVLKNAKRELLNSATKLQRCAASLKDELEGVREQLRRQYHILYREYRT